MSGGDGTTLVFRPLCVLFNPHLGGHTLFFATLLVAVPCNELESDSGERRKTRAVQRTSIPLSTIIEFRRDIGTTLFRKNATVFNEAVRTVSL